ncbi:MAG TPA: NAD(P)H-dependent oxidoreductase subunit E, partial [Gemmatimonadaceae bacterium]|nr:NAD(P)H-dependent oxidoreductase subunit E [Gemmatimonadaceae bacterium]
MSHGPQASGPAALKGSPHGYSEQPYKPVFVGETRAQLEELIKRYPTRQAVLLPALWMVQEANGWVSEEGMVETADVLGLTPAY